MSEQAAKALSDMDQAIGVLEHLTAPQPEAQKEEPVAHRCITDNNGGE